MNTSAQISLWKLALNSFGYMLLISLLRNFHVVFHSGCTNLHFYQQSTRVAISPTPYKPLLLFSVLMAMRCQPLVSVFQTFSTRWSEWSVIVWSVIVSLPGLHPSVTPPHPLDWPPSQVSGNLSRSLPSLTSLASFSTSPFSTSSLLTISHFLHTYVPFAFVSEICPGLWKCYISPPVQHPFSCQMLFPFCHLQVPPYLEISE